MFIYYSFFYYITVSEIWRSSFKKLKSLCKDYFFDNFLKLKVGEYFGEEDSYIYMLVSLRLSFLADDIGSYSFPKKSPKNDFYFFL
jgi:hypothetical protein